MAASRQYFTRELLNDNFEMGYTNLWHMQRVLLREVGGRIRTCEPVRLTESDAGSSRVVGKYYIFGSDGSKVDYYRNSAGSDYRLGFDARDDAREHLDGLPPQTGVVYIIALLLDDIFWH